MLSHPKSKIIDAIYSGRLVEVTKEDYWNWARIAIQHQAGKWLDEGEDLRAGIALQEVERLDRLYPPSPPEATEGT